MQVVTLLLLVAALSCLIVGVMVSNTVWIVASLVASVLAVLAIRAVRRRAEAGSARRAQPETELVRPKTAREEIAALAAEAAAERGVAQAAAEAESSPAEVGSGPSLEPADRPKGVAVVPGRDTRRLAAVSSVPDADEDTPEPPPNRRESRSTRQREGKAVAVGDADWLPGVAADVSPADLVVSQPTTDEVAVGDDDPVDEPAPADTQPPLFDKGNEYVWVIDGRPRYHASSCGFLVGQVSEPIPLQQAVEDGFSPCSWCDPDTALVSA